MGSKISRHKKRHRASDLERYCEPSNKGSSPPLAKHPFSNHRLPYKIPQVLSTPKYVPWIRPSGFHFFRFRNNNFLRNKFVSLASNPDHAGPGPCIYVPPVTGWTSYTPRHWVPFSSPSVTRRATVGVIYPASARGVIKVRPEFF
jgi:hypothetical protein